MFRSDVKINEFPQRVQDLLWKLPHGSGINGDWYAELAQGDDDGELVTCYNTYHAIEYGSYVGEISFTVSFYASLPAEFLLEVTDNNDVAEQYPDTFYGIRDYLDDTVYHALTYKE